ncbi:hypothetical protein NDU88_004318 [Pleurodeles waltl]|uniref:Uncharacterized protein n=1 Tax=Pleurodeles waltl TaxID=8319 RepID=A0AAV7W4M6_PLEWA|nr:hypothetical protein NDU88_004318 [Pleurodeles waltl]
MDGVMGEVPEYVQCLRLKTAFSSFIGLEAGEDPVSVSQACTQSTKHTAEGSETLDLMAKDYKQQAQTQWVVEVLACIQKHCP